jgi:hypothetical protein
MPEYQTACTWIAIEIRSTASKSAVHQESGHAAKKVSNDQSDLGLELTVEERLFHQIDPSIASPLINRKRGMPQPQLRVASMLKIILRTPEAKYQEQPKSILSSLKIIRRIHRPEHIIMRNLLIERPNETLNPFGPDHPVDIVFCQ